MARAKMPFLVFAAMLAATQAMYGQQFRFHLQEATIDDVHRAIWEGQITCRSLVQLSINRAKAYSHTQLHQKSTVWIGSINLMSWILLAKLCRFYADPGTFRKRGGDSMLSRCANPECRAPLDHGHGRFFRFRQSSAQSASLPNSHSVQHHWLCDSCTKTYTLDYREAIGVLLSLRLRTPDDGYIPLLIATA